MVNRERVREEPAHEVVLGKLLDIQARLRGEPASAVPAERPIAVQLPESVTVIHGDVRIISEDPTDVAEAKIDALQDRLAYLEKLLDSAGILPEDAAPVTGDATVTAMPTASSKASSEDSDDADHTDDEA
jgi:hypothetical protein